MDNSFGPLANLLPDEAYHVEQACRRFEAAWKAGPPPHLEDYLCPPGDSAFRAMLHEFILLDVHYRRAAGQSPRPEDYAERFPGEPLPWPGRSATVDPVTSPRPKKKIVAAEDGEQPLTGDHDNTLLAGRYQVLEKLGQGAMGVVYKAHDRKLDRLVAVKVLPARRAHDDSAVARFEREARALARLSHPHIVQAHDSGEDGGRPFLVMEYVEGVNLHQVLREYGALPPTIAADFIYQAALGLEHAHAKNLIHRDLKPGNLLVAGVPAPVAGFLGGAAAVGQRLTPRAGGWKPGPAVVKILDLGLARFVQDQLDEAPLTQEGTGLGTPDYMAPEQFRDALRADVRTDIYGLGCTLYHLIAGQVPFPGSSFSEKADAHARKEPVPLEERCPEVPGGLALVVARMMAKHPAERFQSASAVADALAPFVAGGSPSMVRLRQTGEVKGGQRTMRRPRRVRQALAWAAGLAGAVVVLGLLILAWPRLFPGTPPDLPGSGIEPPPGLALAPKPTPYPEHPTPVEIPGWEMLLDATKTEMQAWLDARKKSRHSVTWLDAVELGDKPIFSAIAALDSRESGWTATFDTTDKLRTMLSEFAGKQATEFVKKNMPISMSGYGDMGLTQNVLLWRPGSKYWRMRFDNPLLEDQVALTDKKSGGAHHILVLRPFPTGEGIRMSSYQEPDAFDRTPWVLDQPREMMEAFLAKQAKNGYRPHSVVAYLREGQVRFAAVCFKNKEGLEWELMRGVTAAEFAQKAADLAKRGFAPHSLSVFPFDGAVRYYAVWLKEVLPVAIPNGLTVARNGRGQFQTIGEALAKVKPGMTIQVLDDATYPEAQSLDDPERHAGVVLETVSHATLELLPEYTTTLAIENVPNVTVRGFHFKSSVEKRADLAGSLVVVKGQCPGVRLDDLVIKAAGGYGICLRNAWSRDANHPIVVQNCTIQVKYDGIVVIGDSDASSRNGVGRIAIRNNTVIGGTRGLLIVGGVADVHLTGNTVRNCEEAGLQIEDRTATLSGVLFANNTAVSSAVGFRVWDHDPSKQLLAKQVTLANNLLFGNAFADAGYALEDDKQKLIQGNGGELIKTWNFSHNWRDLKGTAQAWIIPLAPADAKLEEAQRPPMQTLRPSKTSPLATGGAGGDLPSYVGAVPPEGVPPWDWDRTWKARVRKSQE